MAAALVGLGVGISIEGKNVVVDGVRGRWRPNQSYFYVGNCGTAYRFLLGVMALPRSQGLISKDAELILDGNEALRRRPIKGLVDSLCTHGVQVVSASGDRAPLRLIGSLEGGNFLLPANISSQYISSILIAALILPTDSAIHLVGDVVSRPYIEMTIGMIKRFGGRIEIGEEGYYAPGNQKLYCKHYQIEPDFSSASYFLAAVVLRGGELYLPGCKPSQSLQGDRQIVEILVQIGAAGYSEEDSGKFEGEGGLRFWAPGIDALPDIYHCDREIDLSATPDLGPTVALVAAFIKGKTVLKGIAHLRYKECNRVDGIIQALAALNILCEEEEDRLSIYGGAPCAIDLIPTFEDHRLAMAFYLASLLLPGVEVEKPDVCRKSYPNFFHDLAKCAGY
jgi:3-phosphoshikimate 1-carboxyvinyltransferase